MIEQRDKMKFALAINKKKLCLKMIVFNSWNWSIRAMCVYAVTKKQQCYSIKSTEYKEFRSKKDHQHTYTHLEYIVKRLNQQR